MTRMLRAAEVRRLLDIYDTDLVRLRKAGAFPNAVQSGRLWSYPESDLTAMLEEHERFKKSLRWASGADRIAELEDEIARLRRDAVRELLDTITPEQVLDLIARHGDNLPWSQRYELRKGAQRGADTRDIATLDTSLRPRRAPDDAKRRIISTEIGRVDLWYWRARTGSTWVGIVGGPRPSKPIRRPAAAELFSALSAAARSTYGKPPRSTGQRQRFDILRRDGFACRYCGRKAPDVELHVDHVIPIADGGLSTDDNLVTACTDCNLGKSDR